MLKLMAARFAFSRIIHLSRAESVKVVFWSQVKSLMVKLFCMEAK